MYKGKKRYGAGPGRPQPLRGTKGKCKGARLWYVVFFFFQAEDVIRDDLVTGVQTCALPIPFTLVQGSFNWMVDNFSRVAEWTSSLERVGGLLLSLDRSEEHTSELQSPDHLVCR